LGNINLMNRQLASGTTEILLPEDILAVETSFRGLKFGIATDSHYAIKPSSNNQYFSHGLDKMKDLIEQMNVESIDFVIHLGDLKDQELSRNGHKTLAFLQDIEAVFATFEGPRYHCVGNHDVDSIRKEQFLHAIYNTGIENHKSYYAFDQGGVHFVVLDSNFDASGKDHFYVQGGDWQHSFVSKKQLEWLEADLQSTFFPVILFCHHPLFDFVINDKKYHIDNHAEVRQILEGSGRVLAVFQGHVHESSHRKIGSIHYVTINSMLEGPGIQNNRYALVEVGPEKILIHHIGPADQL